MRTHFLSDRERQRTREFYESVFPEDSKEFVDFYYQWIVRWNDIFVADQIKGDSYWNQAMVHINSHMLSINGCHRAAPYFVAVATRPECRRQGIMHGLLEGAMQDMYRRSYAFAFLMPANPAYYTGLGFRYFPNQIGSWQAEAMEAGLGEFFRGMSWRPAGVQDIGQMCPFANQVLGQGFQISIFWDEDYVKRLLAETAAEQGGVLLLEEGNALQGILVYGLGDEKEGRKTAEIKDVLLSQELTLAIRTHLEGASPSAAILGHQESAEASAAMLGHQESAEASATMPRHLETVGSAVSLTAYPKGTGSSGKRSLPTPSEAWFQRCIQEAACRVALPDCAISFPPMDMMVRILNLFTFVPLLRSNSSQTLHIEVQDDVIRSNCGPFDITLSPEGNRIGRPWGLPKGREQVDIADLTEILLKDTSVSIHEWV